jgi:hypothetical protein
MAKLYNMLDEEPTLGVPSGVIFLPGPKLPVKGYEWAPRSWLSRQSHPYPLFRPLRRTTTIMKCGVLVSFPGLSLHNPTNPPKPTFHIPLHETLHKRYKIQAAVDGENWTEFWRSSVCEDNQPCIILSTENPRDRSEIGVLVKTKGWLTEGEIRWVDVFCRVWIRLETDQSKLAKLSVQFMENRKRMFGSRVSDDQKWCVDRSNGDGI